jgi:glycosyltransferase involved in cell wall biosynthesis
MDSPKLSVVMPTFEDAPWILQAVDSILNQDFKDLELLIVAVTKDLPTREALKNLPRDPRIRIVWSRVASITRQMNRGSYRATGKYLMQFASDDVMLPGVLGRMIAAAEETQSVVVYPDYIVTDVELRKTHHHRCRDYSHEGLMGHCFVTDVSIVLREEFMKHLPMKYAERRHRIYRVWKAISEEHRGRFLHFQEPMFYYRQTGDNEHVRRNTPEIMTDMAEEPMATILRDEVP